MKSFLRIPLEPGHNDALPHEIGVANGYDDGTGGRKKYVHFAESKSLQSSESHLNGSVSPVMGERYFEIISLA